MYLNLAVVLVSTQLSTQISDQTLGFTCTVDTLHQLSRSLELYQTIRNARDQLIALDGGDQVTGGSQYGAAHYRCAWINNHALGSCLDIPAPRSQNPKVVKLEEVFRCSAIMPEGDFALCSNVA